ncbi:hypothetical protein GCM10027020_22680 [Nocardioides salsibiostraticola]
MSTASRLWVPIVAVLALLGSGTWMVAHADGFDSRGSGGGWMTGGHSGSEWLSGSGDPVAGLEEARDRAEEYAAAVGPDLRVGEVMRFSENYYAELEESDGTMATEILVDPATGAVRLELGPAMMWNTRYGTMSRSDTPATLSAEQALQVAEEWADDHDGLTVEDAEAFPGYYTLHTLEQDQLEGMLSVNAATGDVWYHSWHGEFQEMSEGE